MDEWNNKHDANGKGCTCTINLDSSDPKNIKETTVCKSSKEPAWTGNSCIGQGSLDLKPPNIDCTGGDG